MGTVGSMNWLQPEEDFKGLLSDDFFNDLIINHLDCPLDNIGEGDWVVKFQDLEPPLMDMFTSELISCANDKASHVEIQNNTPALKQSSSSEVCTLHQSLSPVSVLVNSCDLAFPVKGMRSKRKRPTTLRFSYLFFPFETRQSEKGESESESYYSSEQHTKKKKRKIQTVSSSSELDEIVRKCTHCETTKTPQWREGPNGPKTLCNACGVRFRSGRLVPEYRPASSPTFIPFVHSNLHKKIIEMRKDDNQF